MSIGNVTSPISLSSGMLNISTNDLTIEGPGTTGLTISGNSLSTVFNVPDGVTATIAGLTIAGGSGTNGGGIANLGTLTATACTITGNVASALGGGIYNNGLLTLTNCTIAANSTSIASDRGGGIENMGSLVVNDCTIAGNTSDLGGGIDNHAEPLASLGNTIIAGNSALTGPDFNGDVTTDGGNNLLQNSAGSGNFVGPNDLLDVNPLLSSLGSYSGPTQTYALLPGSPAIDAGNNALIPDGITADQRGLSRIVHTTVDIGAFESSGFTLSVSSGGVQSTAINTAFAPLVVSVGSANGEPVRGRPRHLLCTRRRGLVRLRRRQQPRHHRWLGTGHDHRHREWCHGRIFRSR